MRMNTAPIAMLAFLISAATAMTAAAQPGEPAQTVYVTPGQVEAGKPFQIALTGKTTLCDPQFSRHEAKVENGVAKVSPYCGTNGPCPLALMAPQLSGALTVGEGPMHLRPGSAGGAARGAGMRHGELRIDPGHGAIIRWNEGNATVTGKRQ